MIEKKRIILAEDHTILREGLRSLLASHSEFEIVGEAADGMAAIRAVESLLPDLIILDLSMPKMNGLAVISDVKRRYAETKVLVLTVHKTEEYLVAAFDAGADGYVLKDATHEELTLAIGSVLRGNRYVSPEVSGRVIDGFLSGHRVTEQRSSWDTLTQREREILKLVAEGYRNKEIAGYLSISVKTVEKHRANLMKKLDLHSASALTAFAAERGLISG